MAGFSVTFQKIYMDDSHQQLGAQQSAYTPEGILSFQAMLTPPGDELDMRIHDEILDPVALGFIPKSSWTQKAVSLAYLQDNYFSRKNNVNRRFEHKLYNALRITLIHPEFITYVGVQWVTDSIIKVYKYPFAKLLGINCVDGGLFHKQGNFSRHGFLTLLEAQAKAQIQPEYLADVDYRDVLLIYHSLGVFTSNAAEESISSCKWDNPCPATRTASLRIDSLRELSAQ